MENKHASELARRLKIDGIGIGEASGGERHAGRRRTFYAQCLRGAGGQRALPQGERTGLSRQGE